MNTTKIACIGCGFMGSAMMRAARKTLNEKSIILYDVDFKKAYDLAEQLQGIAVKNPADIFNHSYIQYILLAVKPIHAEQALKNIFNNAPTTHQSTIVSIVAGLSIKTLQSYIPSKYHEKTHIIRLMPNLPVQVQEGMIGLTPDENIPKEEIAKFKEVFSYAGKIEVVSENLMDTVTAISGSGPAYAFIFIEALADAAVNLGIPRQQAYVYAAQTLKGAATMVLETKTHPAQLKDAVCSPAGTSIAGVEQLEKNNFRSAIIAAAKAAHKKSCELNPEK